MSVATLFAQMPNRPEPIIAQVRRDLATEEGTISAAELDRLGERAVRRLWDSRVKLFVPVLALREVREVLAHQDHVVSVVPAELEPHAPSPALLLAPCVASHQNVLLNSSDRMPLASEDDLDLRQDVLPIDEDWMPLEDEDELTLE
jgi:hypothetical protein